MIVGTLLFRTTDRLYWRRPNGASLLFGIPQGVEGEIAYKKIRKNLMDVTENSRLCAICRKNRFVSEQSDQKSIDEKCAGEKCM